MNQGRLPHRGKNGLQGVFHGQDEAGGKLLKLPAGVHQGGRVGQQLQAPHGLIELFFGGLPLLRGSAVVQVGLGQVNGHPAEHALGVFQEVAFPVLGQVAPFQHNLGVFGELRQGSIQLLDDTRFPQRRGYPTLGAIGRFNFYIKQTFRR